MGCESAGLKMPVFTHFWMAVVTSEVGFGVNFNPFSPTLFLIMAKVSLPKHSVPYWSNPPFNFFTLRHSGALF